MCLLWEEDSLGTDQMGQPKADWTKFLYPLAPLLFNIVAEGLNGLMREALKKKLF